MSRTATITSKSALLNLYCDTDVLRKNEGKDMIRPSYWNTRPVQSKADGIRDPTANFVANDSSTPALVVGERPSRSLLPSKAGPNGTTPVSQTASYTLQPSTTEMLTGSRQIAYLILSPLNSTFERKVIPLPASPASIRIGRVTNSRTVPNPSNAFFDSKVLSRQHAELFCDGDSGRAFIKDIRSSNGTFVNGTRLSQENVESAPHELHSNDILELGIDILTDDNKSVMHQKVAARIEHAGFLPRIASPPLSGAASREVDGVDKVRALPSSQSERLVRMSAAELDPRNSLTRISGSPAVSVEENFQHKIEILSRRILNDLHTAKASGIELAFISKKLQHGASIQNKTYGDGKDRSAMEALQRDLDDSGHRVTHLQTLLAQTATDKHAIEEELDRIKQTTKESAVAPSSPTLTAVSNTESHLTQLHVPSPILPLESTSPPVYFSPPTAPPSENGPRMTNYLDEDNEPVGVLPESTTKTSPPYSLRARGATVTADSQGHATKSAATSLSSDDASMSSPPHTNTAALKTIFCAFVTTTALCSVLIIVSSVQ